MRFHLPRPLHGWREFFHEVGIIVLGVLIALGAQQLAEDWQWRGEVRAADLRLRRDISFSVAKAMERIAIAPCLRPRLMELRDSLLDGNPHWAGSTARFANDVYRSDFPGVYRTPNRTWPREAWKTALNGEVLGHFEADRVQQLATMFDTVESLDQAQAAELNTATSLGDLAFPGPISAADRRANLKLVARLDALNSQIIFLARSLIDDAARNGINADPTTLSDHLKTQRAYRGQCVVDPTAISRRP